MVSLNKNDAASTAGASTAGASTNGASTASVTAAASVSVHRLAHGKVTGTAGMHGAHSHVIGAHSTQPTHGSSINVGAGNSIMNTNGMSVITGSATLTGSLIGTGNGAGFSTGSGYLPGGQKIIGEYHTEELRHNTKKVMVEETYEEVLVIPHKKMVEKTIDQPEMIRQRIVEVEVPQYVERIVEVPEIEYVSIDVPTHETVVIENIINKPKIETVERIVEVPVIVYKEKFVEVPEIQYKEVEVIKEVEVEEEVIETVLVPNYVPQYVEVDVPEIVDVEEEEAVDMVMPVPVEQIVKVEFKFPKISPVYEKKSFEVYVPKFVEIPVAMDQLDDSTLILAQEAVSTIEALSAGDEPCTLAEMESAVRTVVAQDWETVLTQLSESTTDAWTSNFLASQIPLDIEGLEQEVEDLIHKGQEELLAKAKAQEAK